MVETANLLERLRWICNTLFHQVFAVVTVYIFWVILYNYKLDNYFTWHMVLSTIAYVPLMGEAIVLFASDNVWSQKIDRTTKYYIHGVILFISAILASVGMALIVDHKTAGHFRSMHAKTGLVSWVFILLSKLFGIPAIKAQSFSRFIRPVYIKFIHNLFGLIGYVFGVVSLAYGLYTGGFKHFSSAEARLATTWLLGIATGWSILAALKSGFDQMKTIFRV